MGLFNKFTFYFRKPSAILNSTLGRIGYFSFLRKTAGCNDVITFQTWFYQKVLGFNRKVPWAVHFTSKVVGHENITVGIDSNPGLNPGCYIQGTGKLVIGDYTRIGQNCGIMSGNHSVYDHREHIKKETIIGRYCWIGLNSIILPGVKLGDHTVVAAGSVVTKSFEEGYCVIGGNPAKLIKVLERDKIKEYRNKYEFIGYKEVKKRREEPVNIPVLQ